MSGEAFVLTCHGPAEAFRAVSGDDPDLPQGGGELGLLQLPVFAEASQGAARAVVRGRYGGQETSQRQGGPDLGPQRAASSQTHYYPHISHTFALQPYYNSRPSVFFLVNVHVYVVCVLIGRINLDD